MVVDGGSSLEKTPLAWWILWIFMVVFASGKAHLLLLNLGRNGYFSH